MSSHSAVRRDPPIMVVRTLIGAQPVDVHVCDRAARQLQRQVGHAVLAGTDRVGAVRGDGDRPQAVGKHVVQDRQVVRGEVPQHVDVALDEPEVDPHRVEELDVAERPVGDDRACRYSTAGV